MAKRMMGLMKMVICPICNRELVPWLLPIEKAPGVLGVSTEELEERIKMGEIVVRLNLDVCPSTELIDMRTVRTLPPRVHETMNHLKPACPGRIRVSKRHTCRIQMT